jgi:hypothetical protein
MHNNRGQVLIEVIIATALIAILGLAVFRLASLSFELISFTRARIAARHLGLEKIEIIKNLPYEDTGTVGGIPSGVIDPSESIQRNGISYSVRTSIIYIDDPYDGLAPTDLNPTDYKRARVEVSWSGIARSSRNPIVLITDISTSKDVEVEGGVINVLVFNANGDPLPQTTVRIISTGLTPPIDVTQETNASGIVSLPGTPECVACYRITVTKAGYSSDRTYSIQEVANPVKQDVGVFSDQITQISFAIDKISTLQVISRNDAASGYSVFGGVSFNLRGTKIIGTDPFAQPVYKFDQALVTDGAGSVNIQNLEWDIYHIYMTPGNPHDIAGSNPLLPLNILPDTTNSLDFVAASNTTNSLLSIVKNSSLALVDGAYVRLFDGTSYDQTRAAGLTGTPDFGQAFFLGLEEKTYQVEATASGYLNYTGEVIVAGDTKDEIVLTPQ